MVTYIKHDLEFILKQIKIAEAHAAGQPLYGPNGLIPTYNLAWGLRTVDGSYNHLLPGQEQWGAADQPFPELMEPDFRTVTVMMDPDGPGPSGVVPVSMPYTPGNDVDGPGSFAQPGDVIDPEIRTISNLIVDQTLANPVAIMVALSRAGAPGDHVAIAANIKAAFEAIEPLFEAVTEADLAATAAQAAANANPGDAELAAAAAAAQQDLISANAALAAGRGALDTLLEANGIEMDGNNISLTNAAPDEGLSASFNSWFTLFGQFFDHGLDLVNKGGSGTVMIPLQPDDPLYSTEPGALNFMVLTRATVGPGADGIMLDNPATAIDESADNTRPVNTTTSYVDQNQTYSSHPSHQVFLRQYSLDANGDPAATGKLIEGANGGMATWGELKAQAATMLGINLTDVDVGKVPLLRTDPYGNFIPGANGFPQLIYGVGADGIPNTGDDVVLEGNPGAPINPSASVTINGVVYAGAIRTNHAFLADIAHNAVPDGIEDGDTEVGGNIPEDGTYDDELLDAHFVAGDGRANENIGLTAVHHVFHSEHNRLVEHTKEVALADAQEMLNNGASQAEAVAFLNEWLVNDVAAVPASAAGLVWDGERLFQAAKFGTEMQYQHLVFEEFARKVQPNINVFLVPDGFDTMMDPSIVAEFAHVVYRFGHSMLTESIDQFDPNFTANHISLIQGFLNPTAFNGVGGVIDDEVAAGAIIRGMTRQVGNEIDEFVTSALRNNLLGLPLDLATINIARGRDTGVPTLNEARAQFYEATNHDSLLKPYESWVDFAGHLKHEASIINFIAAYGTHALITGQTTIEGKRDAAMTLIFNQSFGGLAIQADAQDFLNATGAYAGGSLGGLNNVDLWIGGLAEEIMPFGGMLGSTFNFVFEVQMEKLQSGDRFYYLQRLDGLHLFGEMENNSFAAMIMRNTDATHLPSDVFSTPGLILEVDQSKQYNDLNGDGIMESADPTGGGILTQVVIRNNPATTGPDTNYLRYNGDEHVVMGGTNQADTIIASDGDDTLYGDGGNDRLEGDFGNDIINGGDGDDIIVDSGGDDNIKAGNGNDVVHAGPGLDLVMGGAGQDFIFLGTDMGSEVFAGEGNDFIYGNRNAERILGNEGNDWIETGTFDGAPGDNFDEIFAHDEINGHDVFLGDGGFDEFIGEGGDDIMVGSTGRGKMAGMSGFDWATYKDSTFGINADLSRPIVFDEAPTLPANAALDEYASMEGLSGSKYNDTLSGSNALGEERLPFNPNAPAGTTGQEGYRGSQVTKESLALIAGLAEVLGLTPAQVTAMAAGTVVFNAGDIILGGDGSDIIQGNAGDDIIDGDKWLDVQIGVFAVDDPNHTGTPIAYHNSMTTLAASMFDGTINPGQLGIVRTIKTDTTSGDIDTARFQGNRGEYTFGATADGQVIVSHAVEDSLDGTDRLRNIERVQFADGGALNIITGTPYNDNGLAPQGAVPLNQPALNGTAGDDLILGLAGVDVLNGNAGNDILVGGADGVAATTTTVTFQDNFNNSSFNNSNGPNGNPAWTTSWAETNDGLGPNNNPNGSPTGGQIRLDDGQDALRFNAGDGAQIQRTVDLNNATGATLSYTVARNSLEGVPDGDAVTVFFSRNGTDFVLVDTINSTSSLTPRNIDLTLFGTGAFTANAAIRFVVNTLEAGEFVSVDTLAITRTTVSTGAVAGDTLNGGAGDDTYSFSLGDGNDVINEAASAGAADRISILAPTTGTDVDGQPIQTISALNVVDNNTNTSDGDLVINYSLPNGANTVAQSIRVANHFDGTNAQTGVEFINFNGAVFNGYQLVGDYAISRADPGGTRTVNLSASTVNNLIAGEDGDNDAITGGSGNDLIFGGGDNDDLAGGLGDDLIVGGVGSDRLDGGDGVDHLIGGDGNDTYVDDASEDVIVETATGGIDTVETLAATYSLALLANIENLSYEGVDADPFVGTGNALNNVISGGDLNDSLDGGIGADTLAGGLGDDTYVVDNVGDVVNEAADAGVDRVNASIGYTLGANVDNLTLTGTAAINGTGNALDNDMDGNAGDNQLFGGAGNDNISGNGGLDLIDGGSGNDTLSGGDGNDTIIGGAGDDGIDVGSGNDVIRYTAEGFGNDEVVNFDATGGTAATQDLIDLSALGITAANFATRVTIQDVVDAGTDDTRVTVRNAAGTTIGTIFIQEVDGNDITISDFLLAGPPVAPLPGATNGANTLTGTAGNDTIIALQGNDTVDGAAGDDTIVWNSNTVDPTDGRDLINGGVEGTAGDTFVINGRTGAETFRIYTRQAFDDVPGNNLNGINPATEIIITRNGTNFASIIAELREIEEIRINGSDPAGGNSAAGGDSIQVIGNFAGTSLRPNTITIDGEAGDDTVDISALTSAHRIVFRSNGGNDTIVGTLRAQDVIELPPGMTLAETTTSVVNGVTTLTCGSHQITYTCSEPPIVREAGAEETPVEEEPVEEPPVEEPPVEEPPVDEPPVEQPPAGGPANEVEWGGRGHDRLWGDDGHDKLYGRAGNDKLWGRDGNDGLDGGAGHDKLYGGEGHDKLYGRSGNDGLDGGDGNDRLWGESGHDKLYGRSGNDHLDGGSGHDRLYGGAGNDVLKGGAGDDRLSGGAGHDTFVFQKDGGRDVVTDFRADHDRIDASRLSGVDDMRDLRVMQIGHDTVIEHGTDVLVLKGVNVSDLDNSDFIF